MKTMLMKWAVSGATQRILSRAEHGTKWLLCLCCAIAIDTATAQGKGVTSADAKAIRTVIEAQLDAFAKDDADKAFAYAAPPIQSMFGNAQTFMRMVKTGYPAVYRPASVTFLKPEVIDGDTMQLVQLSDQDGAVWVATYRMQRQKDKRWRINGCELEKSAGRVT